MFFYYQNECVNLDNVSSFRKHARNGKFQIVFIFDQYLSNSISFIDERERELAWLSIIKCKIQKLDVCFANSIHQQKAIDQNG